MAKADKDAEAKAAEENKTETGAAEGKTETGAETGGETTDPLAQLKAQELAVILNPINEFLTALQQPGANIETLVTGFQIVKLAELQNIPAIERIGIHNVAAAIQEKLAAWTASFTAGKAE